MDMVNSYGETQLLARTQPVFFFKKINELILFPILSNLRAILEIAGLSKES